MIYVFDTGPFMAMNNFFPEAFPSFWSRMEAFVDTGSLVSTREVFNELEIQNNRPHTLAWAKSHRAIFHTPTSAELEIVTRILSEPRFEALIGRKAILKGTPVADPFVIAAAKVRGGKVVTQEVYKAHAAKIPNVCEWLGIEWLSLEGFLLEQGWSF